MRGSRALVRNGVLVTVALFIACTGGRPRGLPSAYGAVVAVIFLALVAAAAAAAAPSWRGRAGRPDVLAARVTTLGGTASTLQALAGSGGDVDMVFVDPGCGPCRSVVPLLGAWLSDGAPEGASEGDAGRRTLVVTRGGLNDARSFLAGLPAERGLVDDGTLALSCGVTATPSVVVVTAGRVRTVVAGTGAVLALLGPVVDRGPAAKPSMPAAAARGARSHRRRQWSRREALTAAMTSVSAVAFVPFARLAPWARLAAKTGAGAGGVSCPSCGSCVVCQAPGPSTTELSCRPCDKKCSAHQLCTGYANQFPGYRALTTYLAEHGYKQQGDPVAGGLDQAADGFHEQFGGEPQGRPDLRADQQWGERLSGCPRPQGPGHLGCHARDGRRPR
jgi:hypothetical protein